VTDYPDISAIRSGDRVAVAAALNLADDARGASTEARAALLDTLFAQPRPAVRILGITGPPGVGKSTLTAHIIRDYRRRGLTVAVLAVDPSSRHSGGALLGDRIRMHLDASEGTFIRSLASRNRLGGLADAVYPAKVVLAAAFDRVLIETVGVGQNETEIADAADLVVLVVQPGTGDTIQFLKAGIMEIPDVIALNKADLPERARTERELRATIAAAPNPPALAVVSAANGTGISQLVDLLESRAATLDLASKRARQWHTWLVATLRDRVGERGLAALGGESAIRDALPKYASPFSAAAALATAVS
jgi:LAO/AO transport system kinase